MPANVVAIRDSVGMLAMALKFAAEACHGRNSDRLIGGALYDVRTVLPAGKVRNPEMLEQAALHVT